MTGLMMVFLLVSIAFMIQADADRTRVTEVAVLYHQLQDSLESDLRKEFDKDLPRWGAELEPDMTIRFKEPDVLFDTGKDSIKPRFAAILDDFFPRYVSILTSDKYRDSISEVRIEGHTSSIWSKATNEQDAYTHNMELSQARTRTTLAYVLALSNVSDKLHWLRGHLTANGLSSSRLILSADGTEDLARSQRVEFRVRTDAEARIVKILEASK